MRTHVIASLLFVAACGGEASSTPPATAPTAAQTAAPNAAGYDRVDGKQAHALVQSGAVLVDVRTPDEFQAKHIEGAVNVPADQIATHDFGGKDKPVVLYCQAGHRSQTAAETLAAQGYSHVHLLGAMATWDAP